MAIVNYVNIDNVAKVIDNIKRTYLAGETITNTTLNKVDIKDFVVTSSSIETVVYSFNEEFINKLLIIKKSYNLGEITEDLSFTVELYNNSEVTLNIEEINIVNLNGINVIPEKDFIVGYNSILLTVNISVEGESLNNGYIELIINGKSYFIMMTYSRQAIFNYFIDRGSDVSQTYSFSTEIMKSLSGKEFREGQRIVPRFQVEYTYIEEYDVRRKLENTLISDNYNVLYLPLYTEKFNATKITNRIYGSFKHSFFEVNSSMYAVQNENSQILKIIAITNDYIEVEKINDSFTNFYVYPLLLTRIPEQISANMIGKSMAKYLLTFQAEESELPNTLNNNYSFTYPLINSLPFYEDLRKNTGEKVSEFNKSIITLDNSISKRKKYKKFTTSETSSMFSILSFTPEETAKLKDIFNRQKGMRDSFYYLKDDADIRVIENIISSDTIITIHDNNSLKLFEDGVFKHIFLQYNNFSSLILTVNEVRKGSNNTEILLVSGININLDIKNINFASYICKGRFNSDDLSINYITNEVALTKISIKNINNKE